MKLKSFLHADNSINIKKCIDTIQNNHAFPETILVQYEYGFSRPSYELSAKLGFKVYENWRMPYGWLHKDTELLLFAICPFNGDLELNDPIILNELYALMTQVNPAMTFLKAQKKKTDPNYSFTENNYNLYAVIHGIVSMYNYTDILEYVLGGYAYIKAEHKDYSRRLKIIENIYGHIEYVVSFDTLNKICKYLNIE